MMNGLTEILIVCGIGAFFLILFLFSYIPYIINVSEEIRYYKMEMKRSSNESTRKFWKMKLRRLVLKQIPIFGLFVK